jgi:LuxR family maltose regulon positive regulatory protein
MESWSNQPAGQLNDPLLTTKLYMPRPRRNFVSRPRLTSQLDQALACALIVISAPAGFGKTTLLSEWNFAKAEGERMTDEEKIHPSRVAWLSLDEDDNDPARFLSYLIAALQTIQPELGAATLAVLRAQYPSLVPVQNDVAAWGRLTFPLLNEIAAFLAGSTAELVFILDDYHVINTPAVHEVITCLLDHLPPQMHLVIAGRTEPPLPLPRLRVRQQLLELGVADLRFTPAETATFLNQMMGLNLSAHDVAALESKTEGWIAGLQMAALSMQDCADIPDFIASFKGSHRYVFDYLAEEVLQQQSDPVQTFLLKTSILNRLAAPLCDVLVESDGSQDILEQLERANLFIILLDDERHWFRYHHLFADFLRNQLQRREGAAAVAGLHRRAAEWYEQNGLTAEAVSHALVAVDVERAVRLVEQGGSRMLRHSEMSTLLKWLQALPQEMVRARSRLSLFEGWALVLTGQPEAIDRWLQTADLSADKAQIPGELTALQGSVAFFQRNLPQAVELYCRAFAELPEDNLFLRGAVALSLATAYNLQGNIAGAKWAFAQAGSISQANGNGDMAVLAMCNLAQLHVTQAELHRAAELYRQVLQLVEGQSAPNGAPPATTGRAHVGLGGILYQWNKLDEATAHLQHGLAWGQQHGDAVTLLHGYLTLAQVEQARGNVSGAFAAVSNAEKFAQSNNLPSWGMRLAACRVRLWLAQGHVEAAARWLEKDWLDLSRDSADDSAGYPAELREVAQLTQARLLMAQENPDAALALLSTLLETVERAGRSASVLEILVLQAMAHAARNNITKAKATLGKSLLIAQPQGYCRLFIDAGPAMADLLNQPELDDLAPDYIREILAAFPSPAPAAEQIEFQLIDPLSDRELELLQLIAGGMSNQQVADELILTVGTVKWHLSNIYSKLGVGSRTQAVARARELQLL